MSLGVVTTTAMGMPRPVRARTVLRPVTYPPTTTAPRTLLMLHVMPLLVIQEVNLIESFLEFARASRLDLMNKGKVMLQMSFGGPSALASFVAPRAYRISV